MVFSSSSDKPSLLRLPHPYLTTYEVVPTSTQISTGPTFQAALSRVQKIPQQQQAGLPEPLHSAELFFSEPRKPQDDQVPAESVNTPWARAQRASIVTFSWTLDHAPSMGQIWLAIYALLSYYTDHEQLRLKLRGRGSEGLKNVLIDVSLAHYEPNETDAPRPNLSSDPFLQRSAFWQGAGCPFGPRPVWAPEPNPSWAQKPLPQYPPPALTHRVTTGFPQARTHIRHPKRPSKPTPGSIIYSRYVPHLDEHISMVALDYTNDVHLNLFHTWQNDPRVAQGWNERGTLNEHRQYLLNMHNDPHIFTVIVAFDDTPFAYLEFYWCIEDHLGAYYQFPDFARGRHALVGDSRFRGPHRVYAWWSGMTHYLFLDEPRTMQIVGEPKATSAHVLKYEFGLGASLLKWVDLPHKRSALMWYDRERFFQLSPFGWNGHIIAPDGLNAHIDPGKAKL